MSVSKLKNKTDCRKVDLIIVQRVPPRVVHQPTDEELSVPNSYGEVLPNADFLKQHFFREGRLTETQAAFVYSAEGDHPIVPRTNPCERR